MISLLSIQRLKFLNIFFRFSLFFTLCASLYFITISFQNLTGSWNISLIGIISIIFSWLPWTVTLPTIFRYSRSIADSVMGLTFTTIIHAIFQIFAALTFFDDLSINKYGFLFFPFIFLFTISANLLNIFYAMPISDKTYANPKHLALGLVGTSVYLLQQLNPDFTFNIVQEIFSEFILVLSSVLLFDYLIQTLTQHRLRSQQKFWSSICVLGGCMAGYISHLRGHFVTEKDALFGSSIALLLFLIIVFIEEIVWSIHQIKKY